MKAIQIEGKIKVYNPLPNSWKGVMGNFSKLSDEEINWCKNPPTSKVMFF